MSKQSASLLRVAVVGGGPAGSALALYALKYAREAGRDLSVTIYEGRDFREAGPSGCNMCAGIVPLSDLKQFGELGIALPPGMILARVSGYALHTSAGVLSATQPDARAQIVSVYRGSGPRRGNPPPGLLSFDQLLLDEAVARGAALRRSFACAVRRGPPVSVVDTEREEAFDLVVLAAGVNGHRLSLEGFDYRPPPTGLMCQAEIHLGEDEVDRRLGRSVHIFLPPDGVASYGILIPKGPYVTVSLLDAPGRVPGLNRFLALEEVRSVLGADFTVVCGCRPRVSVGLGTNIADGGFVAIGDASASRLYKNGIGSALATAERAAWTAVHRGCGKADFAASYLPLCRAIHADNRFGRFLFLQVPLLKRFPMLPMAHRRLATTLSPGHPVRDLHSRILWGMFTGAYSYSDLFGMAIRPRLVAELVRALGRSVLGSDG
ncbi:MAG: NAD(P)/FAD-dependent oxidoreductase [Chloroflexota bacterium]